MAESVRNVQKTHVVNHDLLRKNCPWLQYLIHGDDNPSGAIHLFTILAVNTASVRSPLRFRAELLAIPTDLQLPSHNLTVIGRAGGKSKQCRKDEERGHSIGPCASKRPQVRRRPSVFGLRP